MSKAEDRAFEKYPDYRGMDGGYVTQRNKRMVYIEGYHQAERERLGTACDDNGQRTLIIDLSLNKQQVIYGKFKNKNGQICT